MQIYLGFLVLAIYLKRHWDEDWRGWGTSWWFFEVDDEGWVSRQITKYADGKTCCYDREYIEDELGGLAEKPLDVPDEAYIRLSVQDFESTWQASLPQSRRIK